MKIQKSIKIIICIYLLCLVVSGCNSFNKINEPANYYYQNPNKGISSVGRIAIVELQNESNYPQMSTDITDALFQALQKKQVFGLSIVRQRDPLWKSLQLQPDTTYSLEEMAAMRQTLKCDGVLIGTITDFKPYPHTAVGLRLKLIDLSDGELLWGLEQVWNSSDKITENKIKRYLKETKGSNSNNSDERITLISPIEFIRYVSYEVAQTL